MEELITIATFYDPTQAYLVQARLENEGITCFLNDVYMNSLIPMGPFGGIKLQVQFADSFRAFDIYHEMQLDAGTTEI